MDLLAGKLNGFVDNQLRYEGDYKNDLENGYGIYYSKDLQFGYYEGEFKDGEKQGVGFDSLPYGSFRGEFVNGDWFHGIFSHINGYSWQGDFGYCEEFNTYIPSGYGIWMNLDGSKFIGKLSCSVKDSGQYICANGDQYVGQWIKDSINNELFYGTGIYIDKDSNKFEKEFQGDEWKNIKKE